MSAGPDGVDPGPSAEQRAVIDAGPGALLVLAAVGSGKTTTLGRRIAAAVDQGLAPERAVALTFTNRAAAQLRESLGRALGPADAARVTLSTFHALCVRILRSAPEDVGLPGDFRVIDDELAPQVSIERLEDRALLALQGPKAVEVLAAHIPECAGKVFMDSWATTGFGVDVLISRSGYTGEDGYEISVPGHAAERIWNTLLADERVRPIGLGARDSLRLEAGLPLYGHDVDETVSPVEAALTFAVSKKRRDAQDFPGAARIARELAEGPSRVRVGLKILEGAPAREGAEIADASGAVVGVVTSGGFAPSLGHPIAMGFVPPALAAVGTRLSVIVRGKSGAAEVVAMPFVPNRYVRKV